MSYNAVQYQVISYPAPSASCMWRWIWSGICDDIFSSLSRLDNYDVLWRLSSSQYMLCSAVGALYSLWQAVVTLYRMSVTEFHFRFLGSINLGHASTCAISRSVEGPSSSCSFTGDSHVLCT